MTPAEQRLRDYVTCHRYQATAIRDSYSTDNYNGYPVIGHEGHSRLSVDLDTLLTELTYLREEVSIHRDGELIHRLLNEAASQPFNPTDHEQTR